MKNILKNTLVLLLSLALTLSLCACADKTGSPQPTDDEVLAAYKSATEASGWFELESLPTDSSVTKEHDGNTGYHPVQRFGTLAELKAYLNTLFSAQLTDAFLSGSDYTDIDGALYTRDGARGADITKGDETCSVSRPSDGKIVLTVTVQLLDVGDDVKVTGSEDYEFDYELVDGAWVFTVFPVIR